MGQKVRPTGFRTGIMQPWASSWYANKRDFGELLIEDWKIRKFVQKYLTRSKDRKEQRPAISKIKIERTRERVIVTISSSRIGAIIGKKGEKIEKLTKALEKLTRRHIDVKTIEVTRPEIEPQLVAEDICEQLEKRASFRRTMKQAIQRAMENGAKGVKLQLSGRLGGAEMARCEKGMDGSIPLSTLRAKVDYGFAEASTPQGNIGVKVWINNGDFLSGEINDATDAQAGQVQKKPARRRKG
ncbi:30S ribosomal protein S3 [Fimbriiglobus ruber]|uniref:Small ribosomal subunit protein uS3 n=1 Tax=Fimbriiglobus ruber TaxID=1908690 RepID=A0A225D4H4_9BACT|nr:30S ribosomal protein S3 [Fimbriiglobus ruber]OWK36392.1 SSU ribosomal protein S3p (S3e) [Fimbriiglobus ruber]